MLKKVITWSIVIFVIGMSVAYAVTSLFQETPAAAGGTP